MFIEGEWLSGGQLVDSIMASCSSLVRGEEASGLGCCFGSFRD